MAENDLSFYRDLHKVAFFVLAAFEALVFYALITDILSGRDNIVGLLVGGSVVLFAIHFIGRRAWPHKHARFIDWLSSMDRKEKA